MINIIIPLAGKSIQFDSKHFYFPKPLIDIDGKPMIERVVNPFVNCFKKNSHFMFIINDLDAKKFHLDRILQLIVNNNGTVRHQFQDTKGALCSCLLLVDDIMMEKPLIIANSDQVIDVNYLDVLKKFQNLGADAGTILFKSIHPQWSYVRTNSENLIIESAEKKPISSNAIAGFYYYKTAKLFIEAAKEVISSSETINDKFFISMTFNELILKGKKISGYFIDSENYHSLYSPEKIEKYKQFLNR